MKFQMPETLEGLDLEAVQKLLDDAFAEAKELNAIPDDKITKEQSADLIALVGHVAAITEVHDALELEQGAEADALAAARAAIAGAEETEGEGDAEGTDGDAGDGNSDGDSGDGSDGDAGDGEGEGADEKVDADALVAAGQRIRASFASRAGSVPRDELPKGGDGGVDEAKSKALTITASANVRGFDSGQVLDGFGELAQAYANRSKAFASGARSGRRGQKSLEGVQFNGGVLSENAQKYSVAKLEKPANEFTITEKMSAEDQYDLIKAASAEKRLGGGSLLAAGGWCAPSDIIYGFLELESADGLLSIAEIQSDRGGIQFTKGPQLGELLLEATLGFVQTEAEAEIGTVKPVFDIECPDWDEERMDAVGYALRAGLLTQTAYPELVRRYLGLALIVHARRMNALTIQRISAAIGAASTFTSVGVLPSGISDLLSAIELDATRLREQYSMPLNATVEGVFPIWLPMVLRSELSRRNGGGLDFLNVTDAQIAAWFTARKIKPQFVRDYQPINGGALTVAGGTAAWSAVPTSVEYMLYPAGSYVRLATNVIDLDTVYDTDDLTKNQFMAAFFEEGFGIANTGASGIKRKVLIPNVYGVTGFQAIGAASASHAAA